MDVGSAVKEPRSSQVLGKRIAVTQADEVVCQAVLDCTSISHEDPGPWALNFSDTVTHQPVLIIVFLHLLQCNLC